MWMAALTNDKGSPGFEPVATASSFLALNADSEGSNCLLLPLFASSPGSGRLLTFYMSQRRELWMGLDLISERGHQISPKGCL